MNIYRLYGAISPMFRRKRMRRFLEEILPGPETTILDVGGAKSTWEYVPGVSGRITILNLLPPSNEKRADTRYNANGKRSPGLSYHLPRCAEVAIRDFVRASSSSGVKSAREGKVNCTGRPAESPINSTSCRP